MAAGFDEFLNDLREQVRRCAEAAPDEAGSRQHPAPIPLRPRRTRLTLGWAATAVAVAALAAVAIVATRPTTSPPVPSAANGVLPGVSAYAYVRPAPTETASPATTASPTPTVAPALDYALWSVAGRSGADAWAVGSRDAAGDRGRLHSFVLHWNGVVWNEASTPDVGLLTAVTVAASGDAWALGPSASIALHWDGVKWSAVPTGAPDGSTLNGIAAISSNDVWAVGVQPAGALIEHWNGTAWQTVAPPADAPPAVALSAVSAASATDVWAVGGAAGRAVLFSWHGTGWTLAPGPPLQNEAETGSTALWAVAAVSPVAVWAADDQLWLWDGVAWRQSGGAYEGASGGLSGVSATDVWLAAGQAGLAHWDGTVWRTLGAADLGLSGGATVAVRSVNAVSSTDVWAVGTIQKTPDAPSLPLALHWNGGSWSVVVDSVRTP